jgi:2-methylfumaryl-CoA hydratase
MVRKRDPAAPAPAAHVPALPEAVAPEALVVPAGLRFERYDRKLAGSPHAYDDYEIGERIDHRDGMTLEEAEHAMATRLYQNTARVHFDAHEQKGSRFGRRLVYGGHIISLARALSFNGLGNAVKLAAINGGRHAAPSFAGDTLYAWSEVIGKAPAGNDVGALRLRTIATKDRPCADFPREDPAVVLELDYWALLPR